MPASLPYGSPLASVSSPSPWSLWSGAVSFQEWFITQQSGLINRRRQFSGVAGVNKTAALNAAAPANRRKSRLSLSCASGCRKKDDLTDLDIDREFHIKCFEKCK